MLTTSRPSVAKDPPQLGEHVLHYLARYTHRVAISNHRLLAFEDDKVTFRWKDYAHGNKKRKMTLSADEFIRRFLLHILPRGFTASATSAYSPTEAVTNSSRSAVSYSRIHWHHARPLLPRSRRR